MQDLLDDSGSIRLAYGETIPEYCGRKSLRYADMRVDFRGGGIPMNFMDKGSFSIMSRGDTELPEGGVEINC